MPGLTAEDAARRLVEEGPNTLDTAPRRGWVAIVLHTAREPMFMLLLGAAALYLLLGDLQEGAALLGCVLATLALTLFQERRTERAVAALRDLSSPRALVLRDGRPVRIAGRDVVRGDALRLAEGDRVPADATLLDGNGLQLDESLLTGESVPLLKQPGEPLFAGTLVVQGQGLAEVTATGGRSQLGRIGSTLGALQEPPSPLQRQTARLVRSIAFIALVLSLLLILTQGWLRGDWLAAVLAGIALAMAILPEEYPVVLTVFQALGAWRLSRGGVLVRRLSAIETLGATSVLCTDKTGTLTHNRMAVVQLVAGGTSLDAHAHAEQWRRDGLPEPFHALLEYSILASATEPFDPMERAFHALGRELLDGTEHLHRDWQLVQAYQLTPALRAMSQVWLAAEDGGQVVAAKGAPEAVMDLCHLPAATCAHISAEVEALAAQGLRVLAVARGRFEGSAWPDNAHAFDFTFLGLIGLADPLREGIAEAVAECRAAGIHVVMITGDHPATARAIAAQAGLADPGDGEVLSGDQLDALDDAALRQRLARTAVCARIAPAQKLRIVQALQAGGAVVAMTGDGVNDAPALRAAHVGVAMGARGTDVAREAAALVLLQDDFGAMVGGLRLGRRIYDNLRKSVAYLLAVHVPIAGLALLPVLLGWPALLLPTHIALLELLIDPACSLAFESEPAEPDLMRRAPRNPEDPLLEPRLLVRALLQGAGALALLVFAHGQVLQQHGSETARAFSFVALVASNLVLILSCRTRERPLWHAWQVRNRTLWAVVLLGAAVSIGLTQWPAAARVLRFDVLPPGLLLQAFALGASCLVGFEAVKTLLRR